MACIKKKKKRRPWKIWLLTLNPNVLVHIYVYVFVYTYMCVFISFLLGFWVIFNNCIFFTHSLTLFQNKHLVLGIWYCQSIQNPRPNTCWFLIQNLVSHGILTYFQTNSVKISIHCLHANALAFNGKMWTWSNFKRWVLALPSACLSSQLQNTLLTAKLRISS